MVMGSTQRQTMFCCCCCCSLSDFKNIVSIVLCVHTLRRNDGIFAVDGNFLSFVWFCMSFGQFKTKRRSFPQLTFFSLLSLVCVKMARFFLNDHDNACYLIAFFPRKTVSSIFFLWKSPVASRFRSNRKCHLLETPFKIACQWKKKMEKSTNKIRF